MASRHDIELWLVLTDPEEARHYVQTFDWQQPFIPDRVELDSGRKIFFDKMSDADAVAAAMALLRDIQIPREMHEKNLIPWEH